MKTDILILGGDVLEEKQDGLHYTYDNWTTDNAVRGLSEWSDIIKVARNESVEYITKYTEGERKIFYDIVSVDFDRHEFLQKEKRK
jgi:hypothetical protein